MARLTRRVLLITLLAAMAVSCGGGGQAADHPAGDGSAQQKIVDRSADALTAMRSKQEFASMEYFIENAVGVMIFPRTIKAGLFLGGEGGNGVLVARRSEGGWSAPAFYSLGAGSAGLQVGYQQAAVVLFFMNQAALRSAVDEGLTLGADASLAAGTMGDAGKASSTTVSDDIYQFVDVGGLFAGLSLDGTVVGTRGDFNRAYYGPGATTTSIVLEGKHDNPGAEVLRQALAPRP